MRYPLSTPAELEDEPELAPLVILASAAEVSRLALLAAHPELLDRAFLADEEEISPRQCIAASILASLEVLGESIRHYRAHLDNLAARRPVKPADDEDDIPF